MNDATCVPLDGTESESDLNLVFTYECMCPATHTGEFCEEEGIHKCYMVFYRDMSYVGVV